MGLLCRLEVHPDCSNVTHEFACCVEIKFSKDKKKPKSMVEVDLIQVFIFFLYTLSWRKARTGATSVQREGGGGGEV